ncbi:MAG: hypothetical protein ACUVWB_05430 [Anaerolineae bacterium]
MAAENDHLTWFIVQHIAENVQCQNCQSHFSPDAIDIISRREHAWFARAICDVCGTESLIMVVLEEPTDQFEDEPEVEVEILFDDPPEPRRQEPASPGPITQREIDELREFLATYHGNLTEFFDDVDF